jgi:hypothetical protein
MPPDWLATASATKGESWRAEQAGAYVAGIPIRNSFDLVVGHLALRYSRGDVDNSVRRVARDILGKAAISMLAVALLLPWIVFAVTRRFTADLQSAETVLEGLQDPGWKAPAAAEGSLAAAVGAAGTGLKSADAALVRLRAKLDDNAR